MENTNNNRKNRDADSDGARARARSPARAHTFVHLLQFLFHLKLNLKRWARFCNLMIVNRFDVFFFSSVRLYCHHQCRWQWSVVLWFRQSVDGLETYLSISGRLVRYYENYFQIQTTHMRRVISGHSVEVQIVTNEKWKIPLSLTLDNESEQIVCFRLLWIGDESWLLCIFDGRSEHVHARTRPQRQTTKWSWSTVAGSFICPVAFIHLLLFTHREKTLDYNTIYSVTIDCCLSIRMSSLRVTSHSQFKRHKMTKSTEKTH